MKQMANGYSQFEKYLGSVVNEADYTAITTVHGRSCPLAPLIQNINSNVLWEDLQTVNLLRACGLDN